MREKNTTSTCMQDILLYYANYVMRNNKQAIEISKQIASTN